MGQIQILTPNNDRLHTEVLGNNIANSYNIYPFSSHIHRRMCIFFLYYCCGIDLMHKAYNNVIDRLVNSQKRHQNSSHKFFFDFLNVFDHKIQRSDHNSSFFKIKI